MLYFINDFVSIKVKSWGMSLYYFSIHKRCQPLINPLIKKEGKYVYIIYVNNTKNSKMITNTGKYNYKQLDSLHVNCKLYNVLFKYSA